MKPYYEDGSCTIYHGDCLEILPQLPKVDLVLTDPPYGIAHKSHGQIFVHAETIQNDHSTEMAEWVLSAFPTEPLAMFFSPYRPIGKWRNVLVWDKGGHVGIGGDRETCWKRDFELIGVRNNGALLPPRESAILDYPALSPPPSGHFAEKPESIMRYLIHKMGGLLVLDPFCGSGPVLRAAKDLGRKSIGIELEERWCEASVNRLKQEVFDFG